MSVYDNSTLLIVAKTYGNLDPNSTLNFIRFGYQITVD
jgi:hypothetical protein